MAIVRYPARGQAPEIYAMRLNKNGKDNLLLLFGQIMNNNRKTMQLKVIKQHQSKYPNPISFNIGDELSIGIRDVEYKGWIKVTTLCGNQGWAPEQYINLESKPTVAIQDYSAIELNTKLGEIIECIFSINQWSWVKNENDQFGWIPNETAKII